MKKNIVIIAGGKGTRIQQTLKNTPKILAPIGEKLLVDYQIEYIKKFNNTKIHFCLGHGSKPILDHLKKIDIDFSYSIEDKPLGTYGALYNSKKYLAKSFFILYGDVITNFDIDFGFKKFKEYNSDFLLISRYTDHPQDSDLISTNEDKTVEKIFRSNNIDYPYPPIASTALMYAKKSSLGIIDEVSKPDIVKDYLTSNLTKLTVKSHLSNSYIKDIGTDTRYKKEVLNVEDNLAQRSKLAFIDRDGTIIDNNEKNNIDKFKFKEGSIDLIRYLQEKKYTVVMVTNQPSVAKGFCTIKDVENLHNHLQHELIRKNIKPLHNIKYCPHHPERGHEGEVKKYKINCNCRKPLPDLILETLSEFNYEIEKTELLFIGDTLRDYELAKSLNARCYIVESELTEKDKLIKFNVLVNKNLNAVKLKIDNDEN
tara:strand:- start:6467 stop:7744 length:1278 start_codon:yes stop_codon:yes gene_type:complete